MATTIAGAVVVPLHRHCLFLHPKRRFSTSRFRSSSSPYASLASTSPQTISVEKVENKDANEDNVFACSICYYPLKTRNNPTTTALECNNCNKSFFKNEAYLDLTVSSGSEEFKESVPASTELFRTPLVSFLYERGWRQNFVWGGFPGPEKEFEMAKNYLEPTFGGIIVDASCGSGLFSRMFSRSGLYKLVIALDFSENMLRQCNEFVEQEGFSTDNLRLVRADISRLPFMSSSVDAVHAGAALHCWPSPSSAVADISRVLRPGGVFVATTFIADGLYANLPFFRMARQVFHGFTGQRLYLSQGELEGLCKTCGFVDFSCVRNGPFVMISATKPR